MTKYNDHINIERELIIHKIYLTQSDVQRLAQCAWQKAKVIYQKAWQMCVDDGKVNLEGRVYYKYALQVIGMSEADIHRMAKIERQNLKSFYDDSEEQKEKDAP